ncbi:MAG: alkaline phosphatase D family protein [Bernardetiaceae bacterium]
MKTFYTAFFLFVLWMPLAWGQLVSPTAGAKDDPIRRLGRGAASAELPYDEALKPFYHGVASGDPLSDRVIIWTRVTPTNNPEEIPVNWVVATDLQFANVVQSGTFLTNPGRDYTVKVDVTGLNPGTTYYYTFSALGKQSLIGKTRTAPVGRINQLKFAVVSCQNYEGGYFNAYQKIAERTDLDAVIHLGDYIYEYGKGTYGINDENRKNIPENEILNLADYRTRYALYRLDPNLRAAHQQHAFIPIWDDHESANDAYKDGAENHDAGEGLWSDRLATSKQVYDEWMPIRWDKNSIYRTISYGDLADLIMLDTRIEGREEQIFDISNPALYAPDRTLLGAQQRQWLFEQLNNSQARWKIIGNQIIFSEFNVGWGGPIAGQTPAEAESLFLDIWDGYPVERDVIIDFIADRQINDVVWLTGDFHCSFAFDIAKRPSIFAWDGAAPTYDPATGAGSVAVEFATPSISSANFDENLDAFTAAFLEAQINRPLVNQPSLGIDFGNFAGINPNPHMKYVDLNEHGYFILDLQEDKVQADWYHAETILTPSDKEIYKEGWFSETGKNHLRKASGPSAPKVVQDQLAPFGITTATEQTPDAFVVWSLYPNPSSGQCYLHYGIPTPADVRVSVVDLQGRVIRTIAEKPHQVGNYTLYFDISDLVKGVYLIKFETPTQTQVRRVVLK